MPADGDGFTWTDSLRERLGPRYWRCPRRIVEDGTCARLWRADGATRGGGAAISILVPLALTSWPRNAEAQWSDWTFLSRRMLAALSGLDRKTVTVGLGHLQRAGLLQLQHEPQPERRGGYRTRYRLAAKLYARGDSERYGRIDGNLVGGGGWRLLPTSAARNLYVVVAALDPIGDEDAYLAKVEQDAEDGTPPWWDDVDEPLAEDIRGRWLDQERARHPMSISDFERWSGLSRRAVIDGLQALTVRIHDDQTVGAVKRIPCEDGRCTYAPDRRARTWYWKVEALNNPDWMERIRARFWPTARRNGKRPRWVWARGPGIVWHAYARPADPSDVSLCGAAHLRQLRTSDRTPSVEATCRRCAVSIQRTK